MAALAFRQPTPQIAQDYHWDENGRAVGGPTRFPTPTLELLEIIPGIKPAALCAAFSVKDIFTEKAQKIRDYSAFLHHDALQIEAER